MCRGHHNDTKGRKSVCGMEIRMKEKAEKKQKELKAVCISQKKLSQTLLAPALCAKTEEEELRAEMQQCRKEGGKVYLLYEGKQTAGYLLFARQKVALPRAAEADVTAYVLQKSFLGEAYQEKREAAEKYVLEDLKERAAWDDCQAILWGEQSYRMQKTKWGLYTGTGILFAAAIALVYGMLFHNLALGICFGVCFASCFGVVWTQIGKEKR